MARAFSKMAPKSSTRLGGQAVPLPKVCLRSVHKKNYFYLWKSVRPMSYWKGRRTTNELLPEEVGTTNELLEGAENSQ